MANRIRGITVEIGGDTTKLDKALQGTNNEISQTQKSLKDVERLLKLDPKNTVLLEQKQRLLSKAVEDTSSKLSTLREAAKTADEALARGTAYEEKYAPLKAAIEQTSDELAKLTKKAESVEASFQSGDLPEEKYQDFQRTLEETGKKLEALKEEKKALQKEFQGTKLNQEQFEALQREIVQTEKDLESAEKAVKKFDTTLGKLEPTLKNVSDKAGKVSSEFKPVSTAVAGLGVAAIATVPATENLRAGLGNLEINAQNAGISVGAATDAMRTMNAVSGDLDGALEATNNLLNSGLTESDLQKAVENLAGAYIKFPETLKFESLADSLQETLASGSATGQFAELLDRLGIGAENFNAQLALIPGEVERQNYTLGLLASQGLAETYQAWEENNQQLVRNREASYEFQMAMAELANTVQPFLTSIVEIGTQVLDFFNSLPPSVQTAIGVFLFLIAAISPIAGIISAVSAAAGAAGIAMSSWLPIIFAVTLALAALAAVIALVTGGGKNTGTRSANRGGGFGRDDVSTYLTNDIPHLAAGTVVPPNNPFLAVLGDNRQETEIVAPYSTIKQAAGDAIAERGGTSSPVTLIVKAGDGFTRTLSFSLAEESRRRGVSLVNNRG